MPAEALRLRAGAPPAGLESLATAPGGHFFATPAWLALVHRVEPRMRPHVLWIESADGVVEAACPLMEVRRFGVRRYYGGAWGTYGGILARSEAGQRALQEALDALARQPRVALVRLHDFFDSLREANAGLWSTAVESCQVLDLPADPQVLFRDAFTSQNRNKIRKAEKQGVRVRRGRDAAALGDYARLHALSAERWGISARPESFFAALADTHPGVDVWMAEAGGEPVAALLNFTCGGQIMNWGNVSRRDAWSLSPNNLLHWRALEAACLDAAGPRLYNFGSSTGLPGVQTFKAAFGARQHSYRRREHRPAWLGWMGRRG